MTLQKTILNKDADWCHAQNVLYVGFNELSMVHDFKTANRFTGFDEAIIAPHVSGAVDWLAKHADYNLAQCIVNESYGYKGNNIPAQEGKYCDFETYETLGYFLQSFSFLNEIRDMYPDTRFAVYGGYTGEFLNLKKLTTKSPVAYIPALSMDDEAPYSIIEYLRNEHDVLFLKEGS